MTIMLNPKGLVATDNFDVSAFPFPFSYAVWLGLKTFATTPETFAPYPVYVSPACHCSVWFQRKNAAMLFDIPSSCR
jgi:hypothetical protein